MAAHDLGHIAQLPLVEVRFRTRAGVQTSLKLNGFRRFRQPPFGGSHAFFTDSGMRSIRRFTRTAGSLRTGIVLLITLGLASAAGTLVLQRPLAEHEQMARTYTPDVLRWLDAIGLTDVFHSWWYAALLALLGINIVMASLERLPEAWRYFARPYRRPEPHFRAHLKLQREIDVRNAGAALAVAERVLARLRWRPHRVSSGDQQSLYAERHRLARLAPYVVHVSLLMIFAGSAVDALKGYRGYVTLTHGQQAKEIELRDGTQQSLPFAVRADGAGQENYPDGTPRRWWSKLTVIENGREVARKEIEVNEPLTWRGVRFFQSSYGAGGSARAIRLSATPKNSSAAAKEVRLKPDEVLQLDANTTVRLAQFIPDFVIADKKITSRSNQPTNPAVQLFVERTDEGKTAHSKVWLFAKFPDFAHPDSSSHAFQLLDIEFDYVTGLQVAYAPGQWGVWTGCALLALGLGMAFYLVHMRVWVMPVSDDRGRTVLWLGASASKGREEMEHRFNRLAQQIEGELTEQRSRGLQPAIEYGAS